jgi:HK97 family phage major capsid protein
MNRPVLTESFDTLAGFVGAVMAAGTDRDAFDRRLALQAVAVGLSEGYGNSGGFLVPPEFAEKLWQRVYSVGRILARCERMPVARPEIFVPAVADTGTDAAARFGGVQTFWTDEADPGTATRPDFATLRLKLKKLLAIAYMTDELDQDAPALAATLERLFGAAASFALEKAIVSGSGIGAPLGILKSPALITVAKEGGQFAATINAANLRAMATRLWGPSHASAIWMMGNDAFGQVLEADEDAGGALLETGPNGERLLLQMPVELGEYTAPLGSIGDVLLADLSQYIVAEREPAFLSSIHVRFVEDESCFKFRFRTDGQPAWAAPVMPENSTVSQSAFITLAARQ